MRNWSVLKSITFIHTFLCNWFYSFWSSSPKFRALKSGRTMKLSLTNWNVLITEQDFVLVIITGFLDIISSLSYWFMQGKWVHVHFSQHVFLLKEKACKYIKWCSLVLQGSFIQLAWTGTEVVCKCFFFCCCLFFAFHAVLLQCVCVCVWVIVWMFCVTCLLYMPMNCNSSFKFWLLLFCKPKQIPALVNIRSYL